VLSFQHLLAGDVDEAREIAARARSLIGTPGTGAGGQRRARERAGPPSSRRVRRGDVALRDLISSGLAGGGCCTCTSRRASCRPPDPPG
jgi:hypothetical protein